MSTATSFDFAPLMPAGLPAPAGRWTGLAKYSFVGGNNDPDQVPVDGLLDALGAVLKREGKGLATYGLAHGPQGYRPLRAIPRRQTEARCRHRLHRGRNHGGLRLAAGARPRQPDAAFARRHGAGRTGDLSGRAEPADPARRQDGRHSPRRSGHADGCAGVHSRRPQKPRRHAESTSTPSRPCRTRPARSCRRRGAPRC